MSKVEPRNQDLPPLAKLEHCPVCRHARRGPLFAIPHSQVYECLACKLRYLDPCLSVIGMKQLYKSDQTLAAMHTFHEGYYDYGDLNRKSKTRSDFEHALKLLESRLASPISQSSLLDVGYGNGFFLALARERGWKIAGIDPSPGNVKLARRRFSLSLTCGDLDSFKNPDTPYDVISFWDVIEHLADPYPVLQKAREHLTQDGHILIGIPNDQSLLMKIAAGLYQRSGGRINRGIRWIYLLEHVAYYSLSNLRLLLEINGFQLTDFFYTSTDLAKYSFRWHDRLLAAGILTLGKMFGLQNRLVAIFKKMAVAYH